MHTVELLEQAIALAEHCQIGVRQDWFGGSGAGACELKGRRWIFLDLAASESEQLEAILNELRPLHDLALADPSIPPQLQKLLNLRKAA